VLFPPNVKGWDGHEAWINANTVLVRFNFALRLATQRGGEFARRSDLDGWLTKHNIKTIDDIVDHFLRLLLDGRISNAEREKFVQFMRNSPDGKAKPFVFNPQTVNVKVRDLVHLVMSTPEYQLG
jgi:hypothetical protein